MITNSEKIIFVQLSEKEARLILQEIDDEIKKDPCFIKNKMLSTLKNSLVMELEGK